MTIKLGIIGSSIGNGHPYSWSAIFNGYNKRAMKNCGFPSIPIYLSKQNWPDAQINIAKVVTIWTQDEEKSRHIARAANIRHISSNLAQMNDNVDAILLARDDSENHFKIAKPFLDAGKPIYIDKPIALSKKMLNEIYELEQYTGQIFTCSALRYSKDLILSKDDWSNIGAIESIYAYSPNSWEKYGVHLIEPILNILPFNDSPIKVNKNKNNLGISTISVQWKSGIYSELTTLGKKDIPIRISIKGSKGSKELVFKNPFDAFKDALKDYIEGIINKECRSSYDFNYRVVSLIEAGL